MKKYFEIFILLCILLITIQFIMVFSPSISSNSPLLLPLRMIQFYGTLNLGVVMSRTGHFGRANIILEKAEKCAPSNQYFLKQLIRTNKFKLLLHHYEYKNYKICLKIISQLKPEEIQKMTEEELLIWGMSLYNEHNYQASLKIAKIVQKKFTNSDYSHFFLFRVFLKRFPKKTLKELFKLSKISTLKKVSHIVTIGDLLWNEKLYSLAGRIYKEGGRRYPTSPALLYRLALYQNRVTGNQKLALQYIMKLYKFDFNYPGLHDEYFSILQGKRYQEFQIGCFTEQNITNKAIRLNVILTSIILDERRAIAKRCS